MTAAEGATAGRRGLGLSWRAPGPGPIAGRAKCHDRSKRLAKEFALAIDSPTSDTSVYTLGTWHASKGGPDKLVSQD
jgi:hypothetical protein